MPHSVEVIEDAEYVKVVFSGEMSKQDHETGRDDAVRALKESGFTRLLVDARPIDAKMSALDDYEFTREHQSTPIGLVRIAVVYRDEESERFKFIENVSVNRGGNMRIFTNPDEAVDWLTAG